MREKRTDIKKNEKRGNKKRKDSGEEDEKR